MIEERCSCGATFEVKRFAAQDEYDLVNDWRENHRHEMPKPAVLTPPRPFGTRPYDVRWGGGEMSNTNTEAAQRTLLGDDSGYGS